MALFENFPYTNFHNLNLDWIIKFCEDLKKELPDIQEVSEKADEILARIAELDDLDEEFEQLEADFNAFVQEVTQLISTIQKPLTNIICLSDSYGTNDPDANRYSWCDHLKDMVGLNGTNYTKLYVAGASFGDDDPSKNLYNIFVTGTNDMPEIRKQQISDIIIVSGVNEWNESDVIMASSMRSLAQHISTNFPNAQVWLFCVQWDKQANIRFVTMGANTNTYASYKALAIELGWHCVINISALINKNVLIDDVHPNSAGSRQIAGIIRDAITGTNVSFNTFTEAPVTITTASATRNAGGIYFDGSNFVWSASTFSCDAIPDIPSGFNGAVKLGTLSCAYIIGTDFTNNPSPTVIPCELGMKINGSWTSTKGNLSIRYIDNNPELWFRNNGAVGSIPTPAYTDITDTYVTFGTTVLPPWD